MIRKFYILLINLLFISCIDLITDEEFYESIYLNKSGWFEFYENNQNQNIPLLNYFTFQIWLSGNSDLNLEAPCILNINNTYWDLAIYKNSNSNNFLMIYLNQELVSEIEIENIDLHNPNNFYLISVVIKQQNIIIYFNENQIFETSIISDLNSKIIAGAYKNNETITNLWSGYVDEIRLWQDTLTTEIITFHNQYPYKVSSSYEDPYLNNLIGLWDFRINTLDENPSNRFQDINNNDNYTIIYTLESMTNELSTNGR